MPDHVVAREVGGEMIILNLNSEEYFGLDSVGTRIWAVLTASESVQTVVDTLLEEYNVEAAQLEQDVHALIDELVARGLVIVDES